MKKTTHEEHRNLILQAACRGRVRQSDGDRCLPMDLYIIAAPISDIPTTDNVQIMFPGAEVKRWCPVAPKLRGRALDAATVLVGLLERGELVDPGAFLGYGATARIMPGKNGQIVPMRTTHFNRLADADAW